MKTLTTSKVAILIISLLIALSTSALAQSVSLQPYAPYHPQAKVSFLPLTSKTDIPSLVLPLKPRAEYDSQAKISFLPITSKTDIPSLVLPLKPYAEYDPQLENVMTSDMPHK